jgi:hypothetical protein
LGELDQDLVVGVAGVFRCHRSCSIPISVRELPQDEILIANCDRLRGAIQGLNDSNCFVTYQPIPLHFPSGFYCVTVAPGEGSFPAEFYAGGGNATLTEQGSVIVTPMVCMKLDRPFRSEQALLQPDRGLLVWKRSILKALLVWDVSNFPGPAWEPTDANGRPLLRSQLQPRTSTAPADVPDHSG